MWAPVRELDTKDHRPGYDAILELRPMGLSWENTVNAALLVALWAVPMFGPDGLRHPDPDDWVRCAVFCAIASFIFQYGTALPFQWCASRWGRKIQTDPTSQPEYVGEEVKQTIVGFCLVIGPIAAWPLAQARLGRPGALSSDVDECLADLYAAAPSLLGPGLPFAAKAAVYVAVKLFPGLLIADAYNYWKHRFFHTQILWPFHKYHHSHRNPSALGGFAVSPMFGFATFAPVYVYCVPGLGLWSPAMWGFVGFYIFVNHYIHCGYVLAPVERLLAPCWVMTSAWHNTHHNRGRVGFWENDQTFAEMLSLWDYLMGTYPQGAHARAVKRALRDPSVDPAGAKAKRA